MITPEEITRIAEKWWKPALQSRVLGEPFFPRTIERIGQVRAGHITDQFSDLQRGIETLYAHSKHVTHRGYLIQTTEQTFRRTGTHTLPKSIEFESWEEYVHYLKKGKDLKCFDSNLQLVVNALPQLKPWLAENAILLTRPETDWSGIVEVCSYFLGCPRPDLYIRQLPLRVHTKFMETHEALLRSMLDFLVPGDIRHSSIQRLAERYYLRYDEPLIRIRMLDQVVAPELAYRDISIRLADFQRSSWQADHILITENKMNFLTLPDLPSSMAIWSGGGFHISYLKGTDWLRRKTIYYWGDLDEHGFQILHQLRSLYPQAVSVLMDGVTFDRFRDFAVTGARNPVEHLSLLTAEESEMYQRLRSLETGNRLEQEKIPQLYADELLSRTVGKRPHE